MVNDAANINQESVDFFVMIQELYNFSPLLFTDHVTELTSKQLCGVK